MNLKVLAALASVASIFDDPTSQDFNALSLCDTVPPPQCGYQCITKLGQCNLCSSNDAGNKFSQCLRDLCNPKDQSFASVYYNCICGEGGYLDFTPQPPQYVPIPPENCYTDDNIPMQLTIQERKHGKYIQA